MSNPDMGEKSLAEGVALKDQGLPGAIKAYHQAIEKAYSRIAPQYTKQARSDVARLDGSVELMASVDENLNEAFPALVNVLDSDYGYSVSDIKRMILKDDSVVLWTEAKSKEDGHPISCSSFIDLSPEEGDPYFSLRIDAYKKVPLDPLVLNEVTDFINRKAGEPIFFAYQIVRQDISQHD